MRTSLLILVLLLAGAALPLWWSPYSASGNIALALAERDEATLGKAVDLQRLQRIVAHNVRTHHSVQRNPTLDPRLQAAMDALIEQTIQEEVQRRTRPAEIYQLLQGIFPAVPPGTRFQRALQLLRNGGLEWLDPSSVYVGGRTELRVLLRRSGLMWRAVGIEYPEPKVKLELRGGAAPADP